MSAPILSLPQITAAIAAAAPPEGKEWHPDAIARNIASLMQAEADRLKAEADEWEAGRAGFNLNIVASDVRSGAPATIAAWQQDTIKKHAAFVKARLDKNKALVGGIFAAITTLGGAAITGGATTPVLVGGIFQIATQIADALNSTD